ncbi:hypothetical protein QP519_11170 [Weeksella virosa]|uniref:hypothetical protein n=1 Tax=Weeksella virosa TaxID=1014 RepID=UPI002555C0A5|nr:hypothetical protein [Weeksella virosa]MDK7376092.1 hypothetical protein [Weeksella virosa]MDK7674372.1 hypothetical protein [Weeksella virosa]
MKKVLFHTGRGGRFYNAGHVTAKAVIESFDPEYYGINVYIDEKTNEVSLSNGEIVCTTDDLMSDRGSFEIDGDYDTYYWIPFNELDEKDLKIMIRDLGTYEFKDELIENGVDENVFNFLEKFDKLDNTFFIESLLYQTSWEEFKNYDEVLEFNSEEEAEEAGYSEVIEVDDKYYTLD